MASYALKRGTYKRTVGEYYGTPKEVWEFRTPAQGRIARGDRARVSRR
jgi:hypothetical protein